MKLDDIIEGLLRRLKEKISLSGGRHELDFGDFSIYANLFRYSVEQDMIRHSDRSGFQSHISPARANIEIEIDGLITKEGLDLLKSPMDYYKNDVIVRPDGIVLQGAFVKEYRINSIDHGSNMYEFKMWLSVDGITER